MDLLVRLLTSLLLALGLLLLRLACRRRRLPPSPLLLPLLALLSWTAIGAIPLPERFRWVSAIDELAVIYALISLAGWLVLECPPALGWWRPTARIIRDLLSFSLALIATGVVLRREADLNVVGLVTTSAVLTAVIGLAAQETLKDLFAGIEIQVNPPFREGDWIEVGESKGAVEALHLMSTLLRCTDGSTINIPNNLVVDSPMRRYAADQPAGNRFSIAFGYEVPAAQACRVLQRVVQRHPRVLPEPEPRVWIGAYEESQIRYDLLVFHRDGSERSREWIRGDLLAQIWYAMTREGWSPPYPVRQWKRPAPGRHGEHPAAGEPSLTAELLCRSWLFAQLSAHQLEHVAPLVRCLRYGPGETIVKEGDRGDALFQVVSGEVEVIKEDGSELGRPVAVLGRDQIFGEMSVFTDEPRTATVRSRSECVLLEVERADLLPLVEDDGKVLTQLAQIVGQRRAELEMLSQTETADRQLSILDRMRLLFSPS